MSLEFYRDEAGDPRARAVADRDREALAQLLESDIQGSAGLGLDILNGIEAVSDGRVLDWTRTYNAHTLTVSLDGALIEPEFDGESEPGFVPLADLREAVTRWIEFLDGGMRH